MVLVSVPASVGFRARSPSPLRFVGVSPKGYQFIPREDYVRKAIIDFKMSGFGRIVYPVPVVLPAEHSIDDGQSGVLLYPPDCDVDFSSWAFAEGTTTWASHAAFCIQRASWPNYTNVPYVFGMAPKVATLRGSSGQEVQIEVPANGLSEPKIQQETLPVGPWRIQLTPQQWIGPSFKLEFDLTLLGAEASDRYFVETSTGQLDQSLFPSYLHVMPGRAQRFEPSRVGRREMTITVYETEKIPLQVRFTRTRKGKVTREKMEVLGGPVLSDFSYEDLSSLGQNFKPSPYLAIRTREKGVHWLCEEPDGTVLPDLDRGSLPDRITFPALGYRLVRKATATTSRLLPDFAKYAATWRGWY